MNLLNYSLAALISYLGLSAGFLLAVIAKEELKAGKKYFIIAKKIILLLIFASMVVLAQLNYIIISAILIVITVYLINHSKKEHIKTNYAYILFSAILFMSSARLELFTITSSLIFLYGLPAGTLLTYNTKKEAVINILKNIVFVIISIALYFIFST